MTLEVPRGQSRNDIIAPCGLLVHPIASQCPDPRPAKVLISETRSTMAHGEASLLCLSESGVVGSVAWFSLCDESEKE